MLSKVCIYLKSGNKNLFPKGGNQKNAFSIIQQEHHSPKSENYLQRSKIGRGKASPNQEKWLLFVDSVPQN